MDALLVLVFHSEIMTKKNLLLSKWLNNIFIKFSLGPLVFITFLNLRCSEDYFGSKNETKVLQFFYISLLLTLTHTQLYNTTVNKMAVN